MKRGKTQSLYKYLPESWIDFYVRGKERKQYIAKVERWSSNKLIGINTKRLLRAVSNSVKNFGSQNADASVRPTVGFGESCELTLENCDVLTPKVSEVDRGIVATVSPLTFYCKKCHKVHKFKNIDRYKRYPKCSCGGNLQQFRQIYFCKCGYATDDHPARCPEHGDSNLVWDGKYAFRCTVCGRKIQMQVKCPNCGSMLSVKNALDPAQFFPFSISLIDLINEKLENFLSDTDHGKHIVMAYWLGKITLEDLYAIIEKGIVDNKEEYEKIYQDWYQQFMQMSGDENYAKNAAAMVANKQTNSKYNLLAQNVATLYPASTDTSILAEMMLEFTMVKALKDSSTLDNAIRISKLLNTNANPEAYRAIAHKLGISDIQACDGIPFVACSYGYTRVESEYGEGVQLHALKEEEPGRKNVYATKMTTEGVLFEFDRKRILEWLLKNEYLAKEECPDMSSEEEIKLWFINNIKPSCISPFSNIEEHTSKTTYYVYRLIHTISHLLVRAAATIGGLGKDSISEYIFVGVPAVLLYCQNSQGFNLGSLRNTFEAYLDAWLNEAKKAAQKCIFDPVCMEKKQACSGCLFLNEVSCQHFNKDLDRSLIIGRINKETHAVTYGFWEEE